MSFSAESSVFSHSFILKYENKQISACSWLFLQEMRTSPLMSPHQPCSLYTTWWVLFHVPVVHEASMLEMEAPLAHHSLRRMQAALTRTWRKTRDNRQKHTPADTTLAPSLALCSARSQHESQCVRFSFPPTSCHLFSVLRNTELPLAAGLPQGGKNCLLESFKKKKRNGKRKIVANWVRLLFRQSSGTVELFSDSCFHFELLRVRSSSETKEMSSSTLPQHANTTSYTFHNSSC